jgi:3-deoxy-D-manno-octulosonic-acid transferase
MALNRILFYRMALKRMIVHIITFSKMICQISFDNMTFVTKTDRTVKSKQTVAIEQLLYYNTLTECHSTKCRDGK